MKYLLLIAVLVIAYVLWRNARMAREAPPPRPQPRHGAPQEMVSCARCGLHLPRSEAVTGGDGLPYCSQEHRLRSGH